MAVGVSQREINELGMLSMASEQDIGGLQVAMGDAAGVEVCKSIEEFRKDS